MPTPIDKRSVSGRPLYRDPDGGVYSEKTVTFPIGDIWYTFPSVDSNGNIQSEDQVREYVLRHGPIDPITGEVFPSFKNLKEAEAYALNRSKTRLPKQNVWKGNNMDDFISPLRYEEPDYTGSWELPLLDRMLIRRRESNPVLRPFKDLMSTVDNYAYSPDQTMAELLPALSKSILTKGGRRLPGQSLRSILGRYGRQIQQLPANRTMNAGEAARRFADATTYQQQDVNQNALVRQIFEDVTGRPWPW